MNDISWPMTLVESGFEEIEVRREGKVIYRGTEPAGYSRHLMVGDSVWYRRKNNSRMTKKWELTLHQGTPHIRFGDTFGKRPGRRARLLDLNLLAGEAVIKGEK